MPMINRSNQIHGDEIKKDEITKADHKNMIAFTLVFLVTPVFKL